MDRKTLLGLITGACMLGLVLFFGGMLVGAGLFMGPDAPQNTSSIATDGDMELLAQNKAPRVQTEITPRQSDISAPDVTDPTDATDIPAGTGDMSATDAPDAETSAGNDPVGDLIAKKTVEDEAVTPDSADNVMAPNPPEVSDAPNAPEISETAQGKDNADAGSDKSLEDGDKAPAVTPSSKPAAPEIRKDSKPPKPVAEKSGASETAASAALHREPGSKNMPYSIQVGAFKVDTNARQRAGELRKKGLEVAVVERGNNGAAWYYVRVGAYPDAASARSGAEKVKKDTGIDGFPVRAEPNDKKID
ncbi:SPOR domain-containing protein [Thalassospira sp. TSL5-1]|uniref:SPOR domain-containing protein n=1 Tax=Thalassospira sp. TSL5-1 TaxID=1544451 RepID=UPI001160E998|nr:SPOR domain-containing protein [Thalassospira sp. TSL5-1]